MVFKVQSNVVVMVLVTGALLLFACIATLVAVVDLSAEVEKSRRMDCVSRVLNGFKTPPGCEEYIDVVE